MRDANARIREKFELSLDGRQIASIVVGALVILGVVFVLGLNVGRQIAARQVEGAHAGDLEALDRAPASPAAVDESSLTFHDRLTKQRPVPQPIVTPFPKPLPSPEAAPVGAAQGVAAVVPAFPAPPPPAAPAKPAASAPAAKAEPAVARAEPAATGPDAAAAGKPGPPSAAKPPPARPPTPSPALAALAHPTPATAARTSLADAPRHAPARSPYAVQLGAAQSRADADRLAGRFRAFHVRVEEAKVAGKGRVYRVRAGSFESREAAEKLRQDIARRTGASGYVVAIR
jgi:DedD protein